MAETTDDPGFLQLLTEGVAATIIDGATRRQYAVGATPTGSPPAGKVGIHRSITPATKAPSLTITAYLSVLDVEAEVFVQFKIYAADERDGDAIEGDLFDLFQDRWGGMLGDVELKLAARSSGTDLGQDANGRLGRSENYAFTVYRPTPHRSS